MAFQLIYKPEGVEPRSWRVDFDAMQSDEVEAVEDATGFLVGDWYDKIKSMRLVRGLLWALLRRDNPELTFESLRISLNDLDIEPIREDEDDDPKDEPNDSDESGTGVSS